MEKLQELSRGERAGKNEKERKKSSEKKARINRDQCIA
jgi:hypothetical protein